MSFEEAKEVFEDENAILFDNPDHSYEEDRFLIIGSIKSSKICIVSHCYKDSENVIRIISAREATKKEKKPTKKPVCKESKKTDNYKYQYRSNRIF